MTAYAIDQYNFALWNGPPPPVPTQQVAVSRRPGVSGVAHHLLGTWGETFEVTLTSHFQNQLLAVTAYTQFIALIGTGGKQLKYNNINWTSMHGTIYHVNAVQRVLLRSVPRIVGFNYDYIGGAIQVLKVTLTPQKV
ncbi:MAG: hypothetical protein WC829_24615 [Hyphomicrobium sp.]|jgi:hypothetical protein